MKKILLAVLVSIVSFHSSRIFADTILPRSISGELVLESSGNPYIADWNIVVEPDSKLTILPGVEIYIYQDKSIHVYGTIKAFGTEEEQILIRNIEGSQFWNGFLLFPNSYVDMNYTTIKNGVFWGDSCEVSINNSIFLNEQKILELPYIYVLDSKFTFTNSKMTSNNTGNGIVLRGGKNIEVSNSVFVNSPDAIEYSYISDSKICNNIILGSDDDCIDINGSENIEITGNSIFTTKDKGISIGNSNQDSSKNILIKRNVITNCKYGAAIKGGADACFVNNTFRSCEIAVYCYEKEKDTGGGYANVVNCIFSNVEKNFQLEADSKIDIKYSIFDSILVEGEGNILGNPMFVNPNNNDFSISYYSPCLDAGSPYADLDEDSTIADIGALFYDQRIPDLVINEINYSSKLEYDSGDWIEIYNNSERRINLKQWKLEIDETESYEFKREFLLESNQFAIIVNDSVKYQNRFEICDNAFFVMNLELPNSAKIGIRDSIERMIDIVEYTNNSPWDSIADGYGHTLELKNPKYDNSLPESWAASWFEGSPCNINSRYLDSNLKVDDYNIKNLNSVIVFPNPANRVLNIKFLNIDSKNIEINLFDILGNSVEFDKVFTYLDKNQDYITIVLPEKVFSGYYLLSIKAGTRQRIIPVNIIN